MFRWTIKFGTESATSFDDVTIVNNSADQANTGTEEIVTCEDTYALNGNPPTEGMGVPSWKLLSGGGVFDDPDIPTPTVTGLSKGKIYWFIPSQKKIQIKHVLQQIQLPLSMERHPKLLQGMTL